ncbi:copper transporter [Solicola sp. PLA-1-18]|uniref:copper transporter n=1 Tax=Solicola sp. PLA-1-18 TaxID=3380532 RepID=UPI003B8223D8
MIDFRYHIVSLVAVFLALAVGVTLGAGLLGGALDTDLASADDSASRSQTAADQQVRQFQDDFADGVAPALIKDQLSGAGVTVFVLPGADGSAVREVTGDITAAGGKVTSQVALSSKLLDPSGRQFAEGVADQSLSGVDGVPSGGESYGRVGTALARAFLTDADTPAAVDESATTIASAFTESGLAKAEKTPTERGTLAVLVAGDPDGSGTGDVAAALAGGMDEASKGVVVAGNPASARGDGAVAGVRGGDTASSVSTVDTAETPAGAAVTVLALRQQSDGGAGQYGAVDAADGAMPGATGS